MADDLRAGRPPTAARPAPDWPWSRGQIASAVGALAAAALLAAGVTVQARRRRATGYVAPSRLLRGLAGAGVATVGVVGWSLVSWHGLRTMDEAWLPSWVVPAVVAVPVAAGLAVARREARAYWVGVAVGAPLALAGELAVLLVLVLSALG